MRIAITGPESSGKTTLTSLLARHFDIPFVQEYARIYLETKGTEYALGDIVNIAIGQLALAEAIESANPEPRAILLDTWLLELRIWSQYRFGVIPDVLDDMYRKHPPDFYVLCMPDIPWEPDPLRENPHDRDLLFQMYLADIERSMIPFVIVSGGAHEREQMAIRALQSLPTEKK
jgi:nicotinamide riboside kinase